MIIIFSFKQEKRTELLETQALLEAERVSQTNPEKRGIEYKSFYCFYFSPSSNNFNGVKTQEIQFSAK